jgi:outer membrane protein TolC
MARFNRAAFFLLTTLFFSAVGANEVGFLTLQAAVNIAVQDNPNLAQIQARSEAMAAIPSQVGTLPDPVISFNALNLPVDTFNIDQENMTQLQTGLTQIFPFPGKLALREKRAGHEAEAALHDVKEARWRLLRDVKKSWWKLFYLDRALEIISINRKLLHQFVQIAQTKYEVGEGLQQDVLLAQLELSKLLDSELRLSGARKSVEAQLNALLDHSADQKILLPKIVVESIPILLSEASLFQLADHYRALLASRRESINAARSRLDLAKKDFYPDFKVGAFYGIRDDMPSGQNRADFLSLKLSMNIPIFTATKQQKAVDQRNKELMQQRYALQDKWNEVRAQISTAYGDYQQYKQQAELFKGGIIPQARQTVASMLAGYQVNKVDFLNLVRSQITLYNYETQYWMALSGANQALAQLTAVVGKEEIYE